MGRYITRNNKDIIKKIVVLILIVFFVLIVFYPSLDANADTARSSCIVIEQESGRILNGNNINIKLPMASTTKIMTALVVLKNMDVYSTISIPKQAVGVEGSSIYLKEGEKWRIIDLLYGLMLRSGNDSATALAIACGGSIEGFNEMMKDTIKSIGLKNSSFVNPHGLHDDNHYTSAYDLAMITREAFKYDVFTEIISTKVYKFIDHENINHIFYNKNKMLNMYNGANGVKTGYTKVAGRCLVSSAIKNGMQVISVVLNHPNMWADSISIMDKAFCDYGMYELICNDEFLGECKVINSRQNTTMLTSKETIRYPLKNNEILKVRYQLNYEPLVAPIKADKIVGNVDIYLDNDLLFKVNAYTIEDIKEMTLRDRLREITDKWR